MTEYAVASQWLPRATRSPPQRRDPASEFGLGFGQPGEILPELRLREVSRIEPEEPGSADRPGRDQPVPLEPLESPLHARKREPEDACQLASVAVREQREGEQYSSPGCATEWTGFSFDLHYGSYDHI